MAGGRRRVRKRSHLSDSRLLELCRQRCAENSAFAAMLAPVAAPASSLRRQGPPSRRHSRPHRSLSAHHSTPQSRRWWRGRTRRLCGAGVVAERRAAPPLFPPTPLHRGRPAEQPPNTGEDCPSQQPPTLSRAGVGEPMTVYRTYFCLLCLPLFTLNHVWR